MKAFKIIATLATLAALTISPACLSRPHPVKNQYTLKTQAAETDVTARSNRQTLLMGSVTAAAGFDNRGLVYRLESGRFESDFYNEFMAPPARFLADQTTQYLDLANPKFRVVKSPGLTLAQYALESYLEEIYGDYSATPPQAVLSIRYTLNDLRGSNPRVMWDKTYHQRVTMRAQTPEALTEALGLALTDILNELNRDISKAR